MAFPACDNSSVVVQPGDRAFDDPPPFVPTQSATILLNSSSPASTMWANVINSGFLKFVSNAISISGFVVNDPFGFVIFTGHFFNQRLNQYRFVSRSRFGVDRQRRAVTIDQNHNICAFPTTGGTNLFTPQFSIEKCSRLLAEANVPSTKVSLKSIWPFSSMVINNRSQTFINVPSPDRAACLRWQVAFDGYAFGKSFQRAPVTRIHNTPSKQSRGWTLGRPPCLAGGIQGNKSAIKFHCLSVNTTVRSVLDTELVDDRCRFGPQRAVSQAHSSPK